MTRLIWAAIFPLWVGCAGTAVNFPAVGEPAKSKSREYAARAELEFDAGRREQGFAWATRALVERMAACGLDCPEVGESFVQLGDLRFRNGQRGWAAQSWARALEVFEPHARTHRAWIDATRARLDAVYSRAP